ncbi:hypothetical protein llap_4227 [Limosa lapponica baueri]|uniref:Uncharacterized protein n=1 Tax=Limosa lapponica baueri TaxID=1758121 RepID=A0A2I0UHD7_LIMLA|nr:hypothetical protein llap_4227 [Limosa lapponica baueri]
MDDEGQDLTLASTSVGSTETNGVAYCAWSGFGCECKGRWDVKEGDYQNSSGKSTGLSNITTEEPPCYEKDRL